MKVIQNFLAEPLGTKIKDIFLIVNLIFFVVIIAEFFAPKNALLLGLEFFLTFVFALNYLQELREAPSKWRYIFSTWAMLDVVVIASVTYRLFIVDNDVLHIISSFRILRVYFVFAHMPHKSFFEKHRLTILNALNLFVFTFIMTSVVL